MFVAIDDRQNVAVSAEDITTQEHTHNSSDHYRCLICDEPLEFTGSETSQVHSFRHIDRGESCFAGGNTSMCHRIGQEVAMKRLYNLLPNESQLAEVDLERRVGGTSDFVIADLLSEPARVVIEIVYKNNHMSLKRRLRTLFAEGYAVMIVVVTTASITPDRLEHHLKQVGPIRVGRFDPATSTLSLGSLIQPDMVDFDAPVWDSVPHYLS